METQPATESILSNAAALHSLKKEQLIKLCKAHGVKPGGKKSEMADRLAALNNPALVIYGTNENLDPVVGREMIHLGSIKEESSTDFGSLKSSMSLKSIVSSFGFARSTSSQSTSLSSLPQTQSPADTITSRSTDPQPHQIPLPPSPLIEPFTPPANVEAGSTIRLVNIPRFSSSPQASTLTPPQPSTPTQTTSSSSAWMAGDTPMLPAFHTSFDLVVEGGVGTPARDVARLLRGADLGTPTRSSHFEGRFEFGTPRASGWSFRPSLSLPPPVPPIPAAYQSEKSDEEMKTATEDEGEEDERNVVVETQAEDAVTQSVLEEMMRRADLPFDPARLVKPIPRRSLAASGTTPSVPQPKNDRFEKAHEQMESRMAAINEPKGLLKKRKVEEDDEEIIKKSARVGGRASGARPRASVGGRPRTSSARPRQSAVNGRPRASAARRVSGVRPPPTVAKKGIFGFVRGLFGGKKAQAEKKKPEEKVQAKAKKSDEKKVDVPTSAPIPAPIPNARKPSITTAKPVARKVTPVGSMGPPKFVPKRSSTTTASSSGTRSSVSSASGNQGSVSSTTRGSVGNSARSSVTSTTRGSLTTATGPKSSLRRSDTANANPKGSMTSTTRGSSTTTGGAASSTRGSVTSTTRGRVPSTTRSSVSSVTRGSLAPPASVPNQKGSLGRASIATTKPSTIPRKVAPPGTSSRLLQPTKSSLARAPPQASTSGSTFSPVIAKAAKINAPRTPLPTPSRIFKTPLTEATFPMSPSKIPVASGSKDAGNTNPVSRNASARRPRISRTTVVARLAARRQVPSTPQVSSSSTDAGPQAPSTVTGGMQVRKSAAAATGRRSVVAERKVRSSVGGGLGKSAILGRRSVGGPAGAARRR